MYVYVYIYIYIYTHVYVCIYIYTQLSLVSVVIVACATPYGQSPYYKIMDFRGFALNLILILRGGTLMPIGIFPEIMSQGILVGIMLVWRLGVACRIVRLGSGSTASVLQLLAHIQVCGILTRAAPALTFTMRSYVHAIG